MDPAITAALAEFKDDVPFRAFKNHTQSTWARTFHSSPELYIQPESIAEVEKLVNLARRCRRRITTVGCGHSPSDMTCTSSWLVNLDKFNKILSVDKESSVVVMQSGIRLWQIGEELDKLGLAMPNLGSINHQSIAGAISTGTHGSTLRHGILSSSIKQLKITLSNGKTETCSATQNPDLFRASLISLGALGIIVEITFQAVPAFTLAWQQVVDTDLKMFNSWDKELWTQTEFVRVWWFPYTRRAVVWTAEKTDAPARPPPKSYYDAWLGYHVYHNLLYIGQYVPRVLPWIEWFVFGMQYGFTAGSTTSAIQPSRQALLMNCLYSQFVNEWAIPLHKGPEALRRLSSWLNHLTPEDPDYVPHNIPFSAKGLYVHAPVEVRVTDTSNDPTPRPQLDLTCTEEATLYLNATLYRPYDMDPPCRFRYYQGFEWLMLDLGGRPHWAKNFETTGKEIESMYGDRLIEWRKIRSDADPEGMFVGEWHRRFILGDGPKLALEETEITRRKLWSGGVKVVGAVGGGYTGEEKERLSRSGHSSEDSFDHLRASDVTTKGSNAAEEV
ncbi:L-gulonolactone/D-arabinono-1,4-lactone oxidase [Acephala macrosclerotiorum]|nr:L-gulonolactone/D-arabinono-1,4-lactone oxidase [Acephala macrosclerotiorum]